MQITKKREFAMHEETFGLGWKLSLTSLELLAWPKRRKKIYVNATKIKFRLKIVWTLAMQNKCHPDCSFPIAISVVSIIATKIFQPSNWTDISPSNHTKISTRAEICHDCIQACLEMLLQRIPVSLFQLHVVGRNLPCLSELQPVC